MTISKLTLHTELQQTCARLDNGILGLQELLLYSGSGWPRREQPSEYDAEAGVLRLHHKAADHCTMTAGGEPQGIRVYVTDMLTIFKCHVDAQTSDGRGMLLRYVSGYVPKFLNSFTSEWLNDAASDYSVARRVLTDHHPLQPEMALQLAMQWFPQCFAGGSPGGTLRKRRPLHVQRMARRPHDFVRVLAEGERQRPAAAVFDPEIQSFVGRRELLHDAGAMSQ